MSIVTTYTLCIQIHIQPTPVVQRGPGGRIEDPLVTLERIGL